MESIRLTTDERDDGVTVVRVAGELDKLAVEKARAHLDRFAAAGTLVVDLENVTFIDSAGLQALFGLARVGSASGARVALVVGPASPSARVIGLVHLSDLVPVVASVEEAVRILREVSRDEQAG